MRRNTWPKESLLSEKTAEALGRSEASVGPPQTPDAHYVNTYLQKTKARTETDSRRLTNIDTENGLIEEPTGGMIKLTQTKATEN